MLHFLTVILGSIKLVLFFLLLFKPIDIVANHCPTKCSDISVQMLSWLEELNNPSGH